MEAAIVLVLHLKYRRRTHTCYVPVSKNWGGDSSNVFEVIRLRIILETAIQHLSLYSSISLEKTIQHLSHYPSVRPETDIQHLSLYLSIILERAVQHFSHFSRDWNPVPSEQLSSYRLI